MFEIGPMVALTAWSMLDTLGLLPLGGTLTHFLWTLCFLKVYPKQGPLCALCGGTDHKTIMKWVKLFISVIANLRLIWYQYAFYCIECLYQSAPYNRFLLHRSFGQIASKEIRELIV